MLIRISEITENYEVIINPTGCTCMRMFIDAMIIPAAMNDIMLIKTIEQLWHDYIYVLCSSVAAPVLVLAQGHGQSFMCMFTSAPHARLGSK